MKIKTQFEFEPHSLDIGHLLCNCSSVIKPGKSVNA